MIIWDARKATLIRNAAARIMARTMTDAFLKTLNLFPDKLGVFLMGTMSVMQD